MIIPLPQYLEEVPEPTTTVGGNYDWIRWYLDCPNWVCNACKTTMFGRVKFCAYCKFRLNTVTARPTTYVENVYES